MIDLKKLGEMPYKHYLISKALSLAVQKMKEDGDPNEAREIAFMQSLIDMEFPHFSASKAETKEDAIQILTENMHCVDVTKKGTKIYRLRGTGI